MAQEQDWLEPWHDRRPKHIALRVVLDGVQLVVPVRPASAEGRRVLPLLVGGALYVGMIVVGAALSMAGYADAGAMTMGLSGVAVLGAFGARYLWGQVAGRPALTCDGRTVREGALEIPLETIHTVEVEDNGYNGRLVLHTDDARHPVADGLFPGELGWTAGLLRELVERRRAQTEGHDVDEAAARRRALAALTRDASRSERA